MSVAPLFDIPGVHEFLRGLLRLLEEWEGWSEGSGGKVVSRLCCFREGYTMAVQSAKPPRADGYRKAFLEVRSPGSRGANRESI